MLSSRCQLSGTIPSSLGSLTGLRHLCVRDVECRHCTVLRLPACALSDLSGMQLSGTIPSSLGNDPVAIYVRAPR
jgi:hypothetical protein